MTSFVNTNFLEILADLEVLRDGPHGQAQTSNLPQAALQEVEIRPGTDSMNKR